LARGVFDYRRGFFSILKCGVIGTDHHISEAHLSRYLLEFDFRYSNRIAVGVDDTMLSDEILRDIGDKRLTYRRTREGANAHAEGEAYPKDILAVVSDDPISFVRYTVKDLDAIIDRIFEERVRVADFGVMCLALLFRARHQLRPTLPPEPLGC
jgi:hypothetical protein